MLTSGWLKALFPWLALAPPKSITDYTATPDIGDFFDLEMPKDDASGKDVLAYAKNLLDGNLKMLKGFTGSSILPIDIAPLIQMIVMPLVMATAFPLLGELINARLMPQLKGLLKGFRIDPSMAVSLAWRGISAPGDIEDWFGDLKDQGWNTDRIEALKKVMRPLLSVGEIRDLYLRGELAEGEANETECIKRLGMLGYDTTDAKQLRKIFYYIPPPPDMVRMVVREAWREDIAELYHTDEDYPVDAEEDFKKAGVSPEWLKYIWRSHWVLPGVREAFEMLHRVKADSTDPDADIITLPSGATTKNVIGLKTLETLLRTADVMPFWRDKSVSVAYQPITRVDVRRLYKTGVLDEDEVFICYTNLGYDTTNAKRMTDFTIKYYSKEEETPEDEARNLTKSEILRLYREKVITDSETRTRLTNIDYPAELAELLIALEDLKVAESELKEELGYIGKAYVMGVITRGDLISKLGALDLPATQTDYLITKYDRELISKAVRPSAADFKSWLKADIITLDEFSEEMTIEGYQEHYIDKYIQEIKG